jgi:hypothetical protein
LEFYLDKQNNIYAAVTSDYIIKFSVKRLRDAKSGKERLSISVSERQSPDSPYATVQIKCYDLQKELLNLRNYGVVLTRLTSANFKRLIEENYYDIPMELCEDEEEYDLNTDIDEILRMICLYIVEENIQTKTINGKILYNLPVTDFANLISESEYKYYGSSAIRAKLKEDGYTFCAGNRTDNTIADKDKRVKVISFIADNPDFKEIFEDIEYNNHTQSNQEDAT